MRQNSTHCSCYKHNGEPSTAPLYTNVDPQVSSPSPRTPSESQCGKLGTRACATVRFCILICLISPFSSHPLPIPSDTTPRPLRRGSAELPVVFLTNAPRTPPHSPCLSPCVRPSFPVLTLFAGCSRQRKCIHTCEKIKRKRRRASQSAVRFPFVYSFFPSRSPIPSIPFPPLVRRAPPFPRCPLRR